MNFPKISEEIKFSEMTISFPNEGRGVAKNVGKVPDDLREIGPVMIGDPEPQASAAGSRSGPPRSPRAA